MSPRRFWVCAVSFSGVVFGGTAVAQTPNRAAPGVGVGQAASVQASQPASATATEPGRAQRLGNRAGYFGDRVRSQLEEWISRNKVTPYSAAGTQAAASAAGRDATLKADAAVARSPAVPAAPAPLPTPSAVVRPEVDAAAVRNIAPAPPAAVAQYGYSAASANTAPDTWFYDYYNYSPTYYYAAPASTAVYSGAWRYHDFNQDGIYDAVTVVRNPTPSGVFDTYDRVDFLTAVDDRSASGLSDTIRSASRRSATGTIDRIKIVRVNGSDNLVVRVNTSINNPGTLVDLGSVDRWPAGTVKEGDVLSVSGPVEEIGDRPIIIAETVKRNNDPEVQIRRFTPSLEGRIVDVMQAEVLNSQHTLAVLETASSRQVIDLGPTDRLKFKVEPGVKLVAHGVPVQFQNYSVVLVDSVALDGQDIVIERWR